MIGKKIGPWFLLLIVIAVSLPVTATAQGIAQKEGWQFFVDIYGWMPDIRGESATKTDFEIDLGTILDDLQFTVMSVLGV